jgi:hypothetical protein
MQPGQLVQFLGRVSGKESASAFDCSPYFSHSLFAVEKIIMSHFDTLRTKLKDVELLKASLYELGFTVKTNAEVRGTGCQRIRADVVAVLNGDYDIGWSRSADGTLHLIADLWGVSVKHNMAELMASINQKFAVNQTLAAVKRPGLQNAIVKLVLQ